MDNGELFLRAKHPKGFALIDTDGTIIKSQSGILMGGHGLSATIHDFDEDGDLDMIFASDTYPDCYDTLVWNLNPAHWAEEARFSAGSKVSARNWPILQVMVNWR